MPAGGVSDVQDNPPVDVAMIVEPAPVFPVFPTATQSSVEEQDTPVRSIALLGGD
jgi:hypothetical protein